MRVSSLVSALKLRATPERTLLLCGNGWPNSLLTYLDNKQYTYTFFSPNAQSEVFDVVCVRFNGVLLTPCMLVKSLDVLVDNGSLLLACLSLKPRVKPWLRRRFRKVKVVKRGDSLVIWCSGFHSDRLYGA